MKSIKEFFEELSSGDKDMFYGMLQSIDITSTTETLKRLRIQYDHVKGQIDNINHKRERIGSDLDNIQTLRNRLVRKIKDSGEDASPEIKLFLAALDTIMDDMKTEIASLRPQDKLEKKYDLARRIRIIETKRQFAENIRNALEGEDECDRPTSNES